MTRDRIAPALAALATLLTMWSLAPTVDGKDWQTPCVAMVLVVLLTGLAARALRAPRALTPVVQLFAGLVTLTAAFAGEVAVWGMLPGPAAFTRLGQIVVDGFDTINRYSAPVPTSEGVSLILAIGVLAVAVVVDAMAVGWRAPAAAGLPLLALYAVPAAVVPDGLQWRYFAAAATGWLLLLAHDASGRVLRWGRLLPRWGSSPSASRQTLTTDTAALAATGRRLGVAAIVLAVLLPALVPGLPENLLTRGGAGGAGDGLGGLTVINPVLTLRDSLRPRQDVEILRYNTSQADVQPLRIVTADTFDGDTWKPGTRDVSRRNRASRGLPTPPGLSPDVSQSQYTMRIQVSDSLDQDFLPLPYPTRKVDIKGAWLYDAASLNVIGDGESVRGRTYDATYLAVRPTAEQLRDAPSVRGDSMQRFTSLPRGLPDVVSRTARQITRGATNQYDQAMALQQWFRIDGKFTYSTDAPADSGGDAVADFLADRKGFCVQFSSAMAVMARSLGIPARIAVGFLPGTPVQDDWWSVKLTDAHAWPELYFQNVGWVRFEPTPAARTGSPPQWAQVGAAGGGPQVGSTTPGAVAGAAAPDGPDSRVRSLQDAERRASSGQVAEPLVPLARNDTGISLWLKLVALAMLLVAALAVTPVTALVGRRRRRRTAHDGSARVEAAWADLHEQVGDLGIALPLSLTPRQVDERLHTSVLLADQPRAALTRVTNAVEQARYARPGTDGPDVSGDVRTVVRAVAGTRPRSQRLRARLYPPSGAARTASATRWLGRLFSSTDARVARWSHRLRVPRLRRSNPRP
jgi:transglutaminase-like putative cysteine protease